MSVVIAQKLIYNFVYTKLIYNFLYIMDVPGGSADKESTCKSGGPGSVPGLGRSPGEWTATHSHILD